VISAHHLSVAPGFPISLDLLQSWSAGVDRLLETPGSSSEAGCVMIGEGVNDTSEIFDEGTSGASDSEGGKYFSFL
jgi:hypothetical protein